MKSSSNPGRPHGVQKEFTAWRPADISAITESAGLPALQGETQDSGRQHGKFEPESMANNWPVVCASRRAHSQGKKTVIKSDEVLSQQSVPQQSAPQSSAGAPVMKGNQAGGAPRKWVPVDLAFVQNFGELQDVRSLREAVMKESLIVARQQLQDEGDAILYAARKQADEILRQARVEADRVTRQAHVDGVAGANAEVSGLLAQANSILEAVRSWQEQRLADGEQIILDLVDDIARKIFGNGMALEPDVLYAAFARALVEAKPLGDLRIRVHPDDLANLGPLWPARQTALSGQQIELVPNQDIQRGGCYIDGQFGSVDARIETQLRLVSETFKEVKTAEALSANPFAPYESEAGGQAV